MGRFVVEVISSEIKKLVANNLPPFRYRDLLVLVRNVSQLSGGDPKVGEIYLPKKNLISFYVESKEENFKKAVEQVRDFLRFFFGLLAMDKNVNYVNFRINRLFDCLNPNFYTEFSMWPESFVTTDSYDYFSEIVKGLLNIPEDAENKIYDTLFLMESAKRAPSPEGSFLFVWDAFHTLINYMGRKGETKQRWEKTIVSLRQGGIISQKQEEEWNNRFVLFYETRNKIVFGSKSLKECAHGLEDFTQILKEFLLLFVKYNSKKEKQASLEEIQDKLVKSYEAYERGKRPVERWNVTVYVCDTITRNPLPGVKVTLKKVERPWDSQTFKLEYDLR